MSEEDAPHDYSKPFTEMSRAGRELLQALTRRYFEPGTIRALAQAKADANKILELGEARTQIEKQELLDRAFERKAAEFCLEQESLEAIAAVAVPLLTDKAQPKDINQDWMTAFNRHATAVSDEEMRSVWGRVLAGEANEPGSFSKRTLNLVGELSKEDAQAFEVVCRFSTSLGPAILNYKDPVYSKNQITFDLLSNLQNAGLLELIHIGDFTRNDLKASLGVNYFGRVMLIPETGGTLVVGKTRFTAAGLQLSCICNVEPIEGFFDFLLKSWFEFGAVELVPCVDDNDPPKKRTINKQGQELVELVDEVFLNTVLKNLDIDGMPSPQV